MAGLKRQLIVVSLAAAAVMVTGQARAAVIDVDDIPMGGSSFTTGDSMLTLTPLAAGGGSGTFGKFGAAPDGGWGVSGGTNAGAVDDGDGDPATTGDQEAMQLQLAAGTGLSSISFIFSRANGTNNGIAIAGFAADPGAAVTVDPAAADIAVSFSAGTVLIDHPWQGGSVSTIGFSNLAASQGQTLSLVTIDVGEPAPQAAINRIEYNVIPEPASAALAGLGALVVGLGVRRSR